MTIIRCRLEKAILNYVAFFAPTLDQELCRMPRLFVVPVQFSHKFSQPLHYSKTIGLNEQFGGFLHIFIVIFRKETEVLTFQISFGVNTTMSSKGNAPNRRVAAIQAKKKRKQPKKSKQGEGQNSNKDNRERNRDSKPAQTVEIDKNRSFEEVRINHPHLLIDAVKLQGYHR